MSTWRWVLVPVLLAATACTSGGDAEPAPATTPARPAVVPADFARSFPAQGLVRPDVPGHRALDPAVAFLHGPHVAWRVPAVASVSGAVPRRLTDELGLAAGATPAPGHELLVVDLAVGGANSAFRVAEPGDPVRVAIDTGTTSRSVPLPATTFVAGTLAVSVPTGAHPQLRVTDAGRTQTLDLVTGRRGPDAIASYYPTPQGTWPADSGRATTLRLYGAAVAALGPADRLASIQLAELPVALDPWVPGRGWAAPGRAWLVLQPEVGYGRRSIEQYQDTVTVPLSCFRVTGPDGRPLPLAGEPLAIGGRPGAGSAETELIADVPATLRRVTVAFAFRGTIATENGAVTFQVLANPTRTGVVTLR